jgi:hypothetical protein
MRKLIDEEYPDCILLAEANQWPQDCALILPTGMNSTWLFSSVNAAHLQSSGKK